MSQDVVADGLNMIRNAKRAKEKVVTIKRISKLFIEILKIMKQKGVVERYKLDKSGKTAEITIGELIECKAIKPRFSVDKTDIEKYKRRYLPARNIGTMIISTNKGLMTHEEAEKEQTGGCLIAYFY